MRAPAFKLFAATNVIGENCHTPIKLHVASEIGKSTPNEALAGGQPACKSDA